MTAPARMVTALSLGICSLNMANAQSYVPADNNSTVQFKVENHLIGSVTVTGYFKNLKGAITFDPKEAEKSSFDVSVDVATIKTGIGKRDNDLKEEKYFNADKFPQIRIKSSRVEKGKSPNTFVLQGSISMKGVSKPIAISFAAIPQNNGLLFKGQFHLNRLDYKVGDEGKIDNDVLVNLSVFAKKK